MLDEKLVIGISGYQGAGDQENRRPGYLRQMLDA
jgi:hypothetical protein